ncbi:MAG: hypothetical protein CL663_04360 [Bacteroidetes bacterium]|nr:hypothetical protein [Bacteroidota bacterium]
MKSIQYISVIVFLIISTGIYAQSGKTAAADKAFRNHKYHKAIDTYKKIESKLKNEEDQNYVIFQLAECYRLINDTRRAESQYKRAIRVEYQKIDSLILLHYANVLKENEKYEEALEQYQAYQQYNPTDRRAEAGIRSCATALEWVASPTNHQIHLLKTINSRGSDFAPSYMGESYATLAFTSTRALATGKQKDDWTAQEFSDLFISRVDRKGKWSTPVLLDNKEEETHNYDVINTIANEGTPFFTKNFTKIYFTRCPNFKKEVSGCQIYTSTRVTNTWSKPKQLDFTGDTMNVYGHPALTNDELTIIFSAERKGGQGGRDLWMATRTSADGSFGNIINLGPEVNTPGDEVFPFLRNDTALYFSSDGHIGMGGLDIMKANKEGKSWTNVRNLKYPVNSSKDDFSMIFHPEKEKGFFASNRKGSRNDDIYSFYYPVIELFLNGTVKDKQNDTLIRDIKVKLTGMNGISSAVLTNKEGKYEFGKNKIAIEQEYLLTLSNNDYFTLKDTISTIGLASSKDFINDYELEPIPETPIVLPDILYDLGKWDLKPQYQDSLNGLIKTLEDNETLIIELGAHTDSRDTEESNDILSQRRARSVVDYLIIRGIDPERLVAKGYGERQARKLDKNIYRAGYDFLKEMVLDENFIGALPSNEVKEAAHALNRRTEFRVIGRDFVPKNKPRTTLNRDLYNSNNRIMPFEFHADSGYVQADSYLNGVKVLFTLKEESKPLIGLRQALRLYNKGLIERKDFIGNPEEVLAEGTIQNHAIFILKELSIANKVIKNVEIEVDNRLDFNFVIGTSTLFRFGVFTIDNESKELIFK